MRPDARRGMEPIPAIEVSEVRFDETVDVVVVGLGVGGHVGCRGGAADRSGRAGRRTRRGTRGDVGQLRRSHLPRGRHAPSSAPVDSRTRRRTWRRSSGPPSDPARTTIAWTPIARVRRTTSIGWSRSACRSGRPFATSRTANRPMTRGCFSAAARTPTRLTRSRVPVPRGHKPQCIDSAGGFLMERLGAAVSSSGARVVADARAEALVVDGGRRRRLAACRPTTGPAPSGPVVG